MKANPEFNDKVIYHAVFKRKTARTCRMQVPIVTLFQWKIKFILYTKCIRIITKIFKRLNKQQRKIFRFSRNDFETCY